MSAWQRSAAAPTYRIPAGDIGPSALPVRPRWKFHFLHEAWANPMISTMVAAMDGISFNLTRMSCKPRQFRPLPLRADYPKLLRALKKCWAESRYQTCAPKLIDQLPSYLRRINRSGRSRQALPTLCHG